MSVLELISTEYSLTSIMQNANVRSRTTYGISYDSAYYPPANTCQAHDDDRNSDTATGADCETSFGGAKGDLATGMQSSHARQRY
jgi:hypothetical protein